MDVTKHEDEEEAHDLSFKSRPSLPKPGTYLRDIKYLIDAMDNNEIDVNPEYQREVVWTADRMSQLIDSLMENFYIPPIIFNRQENNEKGRTFLVCVDGKQRLSSVKAFVQGIIPCQDHRGEKWWFRNVHVQGKNRNVFSAAAQKEFLDKDFVTFEYKDLRPEQEEDLFARVQMGMPLTAAERMRAQSGPWQELARRFCEDFPLIYSLQKDRMRAKDFQLTLSCFSQIIEVQHPTPADGVPMHKTSHNHLPKLLKKTDTVDDDTRSHLASVWKTFQDLIEMDRDTFTNSDKRLKGVQTFAPIEMVTVTVLISVHSDTRNNRLLLGDIRALRDNLRDNFNDLRMNGYLWKAVWSFIDNLDRNRPVGDEQVIRNLPCGRRAPPSQPTQVLATSGPKRGRPTARTKPPTVVLGATMNNNAVKLEPTETSPELNPSEPGSRKRRRTGLNSRTTPPQASATSRAPAPTLQEIAHRSIVDPESEKTEATQLKPSPFTSVGASIASLVPSKASKLCCTPSTTCIQKQASLARRETVPSPSDSLLTPGSSPQKSKPDHYQAPVAPMGLVPTLKTGISSHATPAAGLYSPISRPQAMLPIPTQSTTGTTQAPSSTQSWAQNTMKRSLPQPCCTQSPLRRPDTTPLETIQLPTQAYRPDSTQSPIHEPRRPRPISNGPIRPLIKAEQVVTLPPTTQVRAPASLVKSPPATTKQKQSSIPQDCGAVIDLTEDEPETIEAQRANLLSAFQKHHNAPHPLSVSVSAAGYHSASPTTRP